jgi:hypothetical protein
MTSNDSEGVTISQRGMELVIERNWFVKGHTIADTVFAAVWNGFLGFMFYQSSSLFFSPIDGGIWFGAIPASILFGTGIFLTYRAATQWLNQTVLCVSRSTISVRHGPIPWPGNKVISAVGIKQLHAVLSRVSRGPRHNRRYTYNLLAETADGQRTKLAGGFKRADADNVKLAIEKYLSIKPAKPTPPNAAELDRQAIDNFYAGRPMEPTSADAAARKKNNADTTTLSGVIGVWTFILIWNGFIWWVIWSMLSRYGPTLSKNGTTIAWEKIAFLSPFVLVGLGLIFLVMPSTIKFFRQKATPGQAPAHEKDGWKILVPLALLGVGFVVIMSQVGSPWRASPTDVPYSQDDHFRRMKVEVIESVSSHAGPSQSVAFFEGAWRVQGLNDGRGRFTRLVVRPEGDGHRIRAWHRCDVEGQSSTGVCDAGEVPAVITPRPDGLVDHVAAEWATAGGRMWLRLASGKDALQPAAMGSVAIGSFGAFATYPNAHVFTSRENPATPVEALVGDWSNAAVGRVTTTPEAHFTRITIRQTGPQTLAVRLWAVCVGGTECDRGEVPAQIEWENGMVREVKASFSSEQAKFWGLSMVLEPPHQGRFNAVTVRPGTKNTGGIAKLASLERGHR